MYAISISLSLYFSPVHAPVSFSEDVTFSSRTVTILGLNNYLNFNFFSSNLSCFANLGSWFNSWVGIDFNLSRLLHSCLDSGFLLQSKRLWF